MTARRYLVHPPEAPGPLEGALVVLWHGAGGDVDQPHLLRVARAVAQAGGFAARARFGYRVAGRRAPERMPALMAHAQDTLQKVRAAAGPAARLYLGGRSMGGRVASMMVAAGASAAGLIFLAYPLHPAGSPDKLRDAHLYDVACPMLFLSGTRDALARQDLLRPVIAKLGARATLVEYPKADHGYAGVTPDRVAEDVVQWLSS